MERALVLGATAPETVTVYAHLLADFGRFDEAVAAYLRVLAANPGHLDAHETLLGVNLTPRRVVAPRAGMLVLFPSYFWHGTLPFTSATPRLTVAFTRCRWTNLPRINSPSRTGG